MVLVPRLTKPSPGLDSPASAGFGARHAGAGIPAVPLGPDGALSISASLFRAFSSEADESVIEDVRPKTADEERRWLAAFGRQQVRLRALRLCLTTLTVSTRQVRLERLALASNDEAGSEQVSWPWSEHVSVAEFRLRCISALLRAATGRQEKWQSIVTMHGTTLELKEGRRGITAIRLSSFADAPAPLVMDFLRDHKQRSSWDVTFVAGEVRLSLGKRAAA